jgi:two-component system sensor histidine kinase/response regulator
MNKPSLLIVEDEAIVATDLAMRLTQLGYAVVGTAANGEDALAMAAQVRPELVLMDIRLAGSMDGIETAKELRSRLRLPVVFLTAYADSATLQHAKVAEPYGYIHKPFDLIDLQATLEMALYKHQAERKLQASEERHRTILQTAIDGFWLVDMQGHLLEVNAAYCRMSGYSVPELLAMHISELEVIDATTDVATRIQEITAQGEVRFESRHRRKDGSIFEVEISAQTQPAEDGQIVVFLRDITGRKQAEEALRDSQADLNRAQAVAHTGSWRASARDNAVHWSDETYRIFEIPLGTPVTSEQFLACVHPDDRMLLDPARHQSRVSEFFEFRIVVGNRVKWVREREECDVDPDGVLLGWFGTVQDITALKLAEAELLNLRTAVEQSANIIMITDTQGCIEFVNPAFEKSTGFTAAEVKGLNPRVLKSGKQNSALYQELWTTIAAGQTWRGQLRNKRKDGTLYWESATISPVHNVQGEIVHFIAIKEDITKQKAMEDRLTQALAQAERSAAAKSEFLSVMSHELRTPLNGVLGFAELLGGTSLDAEQRNYVETISNSGNHLLAVVNDILDFSSIERGTLTLNADPVAIAELVELSDLAVRKAASDKGLRFHCEAAADVPELIIGDARRICQILINLLGNAVKFTSGGAVVLRIAPAAAAGRPFLDFSVADTGIGISAETLTHLFEPFTQADSKTNRRFGGTGLGLAISKRLAEAMGGSITVTSKPGCGSTFTFHLPLEVFSRVPTAIGPAAAPGTPELAATLGSLVLVVEDDPTSSMVAGKMLHRLGYRTEFAADGAAAVDAFVPGKYLAILMDMAMPVMDGLVATRTIRQLEEQSGSHVPIMALTANVMPGDRERCLASGMDDFLSKPIKWAELATMLARVVPR